MLPELGSKQRAEFYQWLFYLTSTLQPELMMYFYPQRHSTLDSDTQAIQATQQQRIVQMFAFIDNALKGKTYLLGEQLCVCDLFLFMLAHWADDFAQPPLSFPHLKPYLQRIAARDAVRKVCNIEGTDLAAYR